MGSRAKALRAALAAGFLVTSLHAAAQVGAPSDEDLQDAPPQFREALSNGRIKVDPSELTRQNIEGAPPSKDPRDFNGMYNFLRKPGPRPPAAPRPAGAAGSNVGERACVFSFPGITSYSTTVVQNDRVVVFLMEENHGLRVARFADRHQPGLAPSYSGSSIARWDGNTLVVDTANVKVEGQAEPARFVERFTKLPDGNIQVERHKVAADGSQTPVEQVTLRWRPDLHYVEDICEDLGEAFGVNYK